MKTTLVRISEGMLTGIRNFVLNKKLKGEQYSQNQFITDALKDKMEKEGITA
jgi:hypothetical protein